MKKRKINIILLILFIMVTINTLSFADVGSFDRYDSGDSSWSSSSSSWDSSSDGDSIIGLIYLIISLTSHTPGRIVLVILAIMVIVKIIVARKNRNTPDYEARPINQAEYTTSVKDVSKTHIYADQIKEIDPNFSEEKMLSYAKDLFVKLQNAWTARDWEPMRPFETPSLFEQHKSQIQGYIDTNRINVMDRIAVNYARIYKFRQEGDRDILEIALKATMKDYIIDATTKELLEGSKIQDRITVYKMTFERKTGVLTEEGSAKIKTTNCPNCGAPTQITSAGRCQYCDSVITTGANSWALSGLEPLRE